MSKHTPGPWESVIFTEHTGEETLRIVNVDGYGIPRGEGPIGEVYSRTLGIPDEIAQANASLIAAAPELLDAMEDILSGWRYIRQDPNHKTLYGVGWDRAQGKAEAAIAKAKGKTP